MWLLLQLHSTKGYRWRLFDVSFPINTACRVCRRLLHLWLCVFVARCICTSVWVCICLYFNISELMQERLERGQVVTARVHTPMQFATQNSPHRTALTLSLAITSNTKQETPRRRRGRRSNISTAFCYRFVEGISLFYR